MAWAPDYVTAVQLKSALGVTGTNDDAEIGFAITAASRAVDHFTGRQFGQVTAEARYYQARFVRLRGRYTVEIDDLMSTASLAVAVDDNEDGTFERSLALDTDFRLAPFNAAASGNPWTELVAEHTVTLPLDERGVEITALWGWSSVPGEVEQAVLIQAGRFFKRKDAPFGIAGSPELGSELRLLERLDPDVKMVLGSVRRKWLVA